MKKTLLVAFLFITTMIQAQTDEIHKHSGEIIKGKVVRVQDTTLDFMYDNEDAVNELSKYAVEKIVYGKSGRVEEVSDRIVINSEKDWERVLILEDLSFISGLKRLNEIKGKTSFINYHTGNTGDRKAEKKLKMEAAKMGAQFILMTSDRSTVGGSSNQLGGTQAIKKGVAYKY